MQIPGTCINITGQQFWNQKKITSNNIKFILNLRWLSVAADPQVIFDRAPEERLPAAMKLLGIDFARVSGPSKTGDLFAFFTSIGFFGFAILLHLVDSMDAKMGTVSKENILSLVG